MAEPGGIRGNGSGAIGGGHARERRPFRDGAEELATDVVPARLDVDGHVVDEPLTRLGHRDRTGHDATAVIDDPHDGIVGPDQVLQPERMDVVGPRRR